MVPLGAFYSQILKRYSDIDYGVAPLPGKNGGWSSFAGGDEIAVMEKGENKEGARDFVTWATGEQAQKVLADHNITPVRNDLADKIYVPLDPRNKLFAEALEKGRAPYSTVNHQLFNDDNGPWAQMINKAVFGGDIATAQKQGQEDAQSIIERAPQGANARDPNG
jgi:multiple sugar transport system substrate-binding protein